MRNLFFLVVLFSASIFSANAVTKKILFLGNSYTDVNNLPNVLRLIALSKGDTIITDKNVPGGYTLNQHSTDANSLAKIQQGGWDYVVVQAQSQEPSFSPSQVAANTLPYAKKLDSLIKVFNPCAETLFYMTWGRKNGDASNCANYPPICTYEGMQQRLRESYIQMAMANDATVIPVGSAWRHFRIAYPTIDLYQTDESHPSIHGTYLAASVFYSSIMHRSAVGADTVLSGITTSVANMLQTIASNTVLDSLETWQQYGNLPFSKYSYTSNGNQVDFQNTGARYTSSTWDFGDGASSTTTSTQVNHTYTTSGNYTVCLTVSDPCKSEKYCSTVNVNQPNAIPESEINKFNLSVVNHQVSIRNNQPYTLFIYDVTGKCLYQEVITSPLWVKDFSSFTSGIYIYRVQDKQGNNISSTFNLR
jgi:hypothetical protein